MLQCTWSCPSVQLLPLIQWPRGQQIVSLRVKNENQNFTALKGESNVFKVKLKLHQKCYLVNSLRATSPGLLPSQTPKTVKTKIKPRKNSKPNPCSGVKLGASVVCPNPPWYKSGNRALSDAVPAVAPAHCTKMYKRARTKLILPVINIDTVTAGLMCPPDWCPIAWNENTAKIARHFLAN